MAPSRLPRRALLRGVLLAGALPLAPTLAACDGVSSPDLDGAPETAGSERVASEHVTGAHVAGAPSATARALSRSDPYGGHWAGDGLRLSLAHDTTVVIAGRPIRFYAGTASYDGEPLLASAFDVESGLALYVDRLVDYDVVENVLYGVVRHERGALLYAVSHPGEALYKLVPAAPRAERRYD